MEADPSRKGTAGFEDGGSPWGGLDGHPVGLLPPLPVEGDVYIVPVRAVESVLALTSHLSFSRLFILRARRWWISWARCGWGAVCGGSVEMGS